MQHGERELKRRALADAGLNPDAAAMAPDDLFAEGQADTGAGILRSRVRALEDAEDALGIGGVQADAVVAPREEPLCSFSMSRDRHPWRRGLPDTAVKRGRAATHAPRRVCAPRV